MKVGDKIKVFPDGREAIIKARTKTFLSIVYLSDLNGYFTIPITSVMGDLKINDIVTIESRRGELFFVKNFIGNRALIVDILVPTIRMTVKKSDLVVVDRSTVDEPKAIEYKKSPNSGPNKPLTVSKESSKEQV